MELINRKVECLFDDSLLIEPYIYKDQDGGPGIANINDLHYLKKQTDWFTIANKDFIKSWNDGNFPWQRSHVNLSQLQQLENINGKCIIGPNSIFGGNENTIPSYEDVLFKSNAVEKILVLNKLHLNRSIEMYGELAIKKVRVVRHFLRPSLENRPFYNGDRYWDVLFLIKGNINQNIKKRLNSLNKKWTSLMYPWWQFDELLYKAERSKICVVGSQWDTYGLTAHEIAAQGCSIIAGGNGIMDGNMSDCMGVHLNFEKNKQCIGVDELEIMSTIDMLSEKNPYDVWLCNKEFNNPNVLTNIYKDAFYK